MQTTTEEAIHDGAAARLGWTDTDRQSYPDDLGPTLGRRRRAEGRPEVTKGFVRGCGRRGGRGWFVG